LKLQKAWISQRFQQGTASRAQLSTAVALLNKAKSAMRAVFGPDASRNTPGNAPRIPQLRQAPVRREGMSPAKIAHPDHTGKTTMPRTIRRRAALVLGLLLGLSFAPAPASAACTGDNCRASTRAKPLNLMRFMDQGTPATSARKATPARRGAASHKRRAQRPIDAAVRPSKAAKASAANAQPRTEPQAQTPAQPTASDDSNATDRAAVAADQDAPTVQMVDANEFNEIDRKAEVASSLAAATPDALANDSQTDDVQADNPEAGSSLAEGPQDNTEADASQAGSARAEVSWTQWAWSMLEATVAAFATAIHALIG
jgi:hypothetical protein